MLRSASHAAVACCRRLIIAGSLLFVALNTTMSDSDAGDWMYRRSYFSGSTMGGEPTPLVPDLRSRSAYRRPHVGTGFGFAARGGYRFNRIFLRSGQSTDLTIIREDWFDVRP